MLHLHFPRLIKWLLGVGLVLRHKLVAVVLQILGVLELLETSSQLVCELLLVFSTHFEPIFVLFVPVHASVYLPIQKFINITRGSHI